MEQQDALLRFEDIGKVFCGNRVLSGVSFQVAPGEICGLVGENGAGKTTLMKILVGMPVIGETGGFEGRIVFNGSPVVFRSPLEASDAGIGMVHQEPRLIPGFTTTENILLNREPLRHNPLVEVFGERLGVLDRPGMNRRATKAIDKLGVDIDPRMLVSEMPVGHRQLTEIARELDRENLKLLVLDEPTAVLTETEAEVVVKCLRRLSESGIAIIFISNRLQEVVDLCHRIVVLRDGYLVKDTPVAGTSLRDIASWMIGRQGGFAASAPRTGDLPAGTDPPLLEVTNLRVDMPGARVRDVSLSVFAGEIFGIGGLPGQGRLGIPYGIMGLHPSGGEVRVAGRRIGLGDPLAALGAGMAFVSEDRRGQGLLLDDAVGRNIAFTAMQVQGLYVKSLLGGFVKWRDDEGIDKLAREYIQLLDIKCRGPRQKTKDLSAEDQRKLCLAKALALKPRLLFVSEPTRDFDAGAKTLVWDTLRRYNRDFVTTIVVVSSELEELRALCHRIAIVAEGRIAGTVAPDAAADEIVLLMVGGRA